MVDFSIRDIVRNLLLAARWTVVLSIVAVIGGGIVGLVLLYARIGGNRVATHVWGPTAQPRRPENFPERDAYLHPRRCALWCSPRTMAFAATTPPQEPVERVPVSERDPRTEPTDESLMLRYQRGDRAPSPGRIERPRGPCLSLREPVTDQDGSRSSRTREASALGVKGLARKWVPASRTPRSTMTSGG